MTALLLLGVDQSVNPFAILGAAGVASGIALGWLGYRRSTATDREIKLNGAIGQVVLGLNNLIDQLQEEAIRHRALIDSLQDRKEVLSEENVGLRQLVHTLETRIIACDERIVLFKELEVIWREHIKGSQNEGEL